MKSLFLILLVFQMIACQRFTSSLVRSRGPSAGPTPGGQNVGYTYFAANVSGEQKLFKVTSSGISELDSLPANTLLNDIIYFQDRYYVSLEGLDDSSEGELYKVESDELVLVSNLGGAQNSSNPKYLTEMNGELYFSAANSSGDRELYKSDGSNIELVSNLNSSFSSNPMGLVAINNRLYFSATSQSNGNELWSYDGISASQIQDANTMGSKDGYPKYLISHQNELYYSVIKDWQRDPSGTLTGLNLEVFLYKIGSSHTPIQAANGFVDFRYLTSLGDNIYFSCSDGQTNDSELCVYSNGIVQSLGEINNSGSAKPSYITAFNGKLYFSAYTKELGFELYNYSTSGGSNLVQDIRPGKESSHPQSFWEFNGKLYFSANNGSDGAELWSIDKSDNIKLELDIFPGAGSSHPSRPSGFNRH